MLFDKFKTFVRQLNFSSYVMIYILMQSIVPIVSVVTSRFLTTYFYMVVVVISVVYTVYACRLKNTREYIMLLLPFIIFELLTLIARGNEDFLLAGYQVLLFMLPICLGYYMIRQGVRLPFYAALIAVMYGVTVITTVIGCIRNPDAARILATTATSQDPQSISYLWQNIGGYTFVYSAVLLYPCVILGFKLKKLPIAFTVIFTLAAFALVIYAEYTFALMFLSVSTLMFFVKKDISLKKFLLLMVLFIIGVILFRTAIAALLTRFGALIGNRAMIDKLNVLFLGKDSVKGFDDARDELYRMSFNTFLSHPIFGTFLQGGGGLGGHSFIFDNLARFGLVGGALMVWMYLNVYRIFFRPFSKKSGYCLVFWILLQSVLLSSVNTGMWLGNLCLYTPIIFGAFYGGYEEMKEAPKKRLVKRLAEKGNEV